MREKYLWIVITALTLLAIGEACYIYEGKAVAREISQQPPVQTDLVHQTHTEKADESRQQELEKWRAKVREQINQGFPLLERDFDVFFGDRFFTGSPDPFIEMERLRKQLSNQFRDKEKTLFDGYWDKMGQFRTETARTGWEVTLTILVPGLAAKTADISIAEGRIKLSFSARTVSEEKRGGGLVRRESSQTYIKIMPVPEDAEAGTGKVEIEGEQVKIKFRRKGN